MQPKYTDSQGACHSENHRAPGVGSDAAKVCRFSGLSTRRPFPATVQTPPCESTAQGPHPLAFHAAGVRRGAAVGSTEHDPS